MVATFTMRGRVHTDQLLASFRFERSTASIHHSLVGAAHSDGQLLVSGGKHRGSTVGDKGISFVTGVAGHRSFAGVPTAGKPSLWARNSRRILNCLC